MAQAAVTIVQSTSTATLRRSSATEMTSSPFLELLRTRIPSTSAIGPRVIRTRWPSEIRVRPGGEPAVQQPLDRLDVLVRHHGPTRPRFTEDGHQAAGLPDFGVTVLVEGVMEEEVAGEHRGLDQPSLSGATRPHVDLGNEEAEAPCGQLVVHELLAVAPRPQRVPPGARDLRADRIVRRPSRLFERAPRT